VSAVATAFGERVAAHYEAWYETLKGQRADALEKALLCRLLGGFAGAHPHRSTASVLEVGAGTGHFCRWLREQGLSAVGLDLSVAMLHQAQALDGLLLVRGNASRLPFADDTFDLVALITTLEFLERPRAALAEALRVARQGLLLGVLNRQSLLGLRRRLAGRLRPTIYDTAHFYSVRELRHLLRSVVGKKATLAWQTTLLPRVWPCPRSTLPWGGFIGMAVHVFKGERWIERKVYDGIHPKDKNKSYLSGKPAR
jgi:ubiquinone/menaquinone biosynthesis C-methylase UbiE